MATVCMKSFRKENYGIAEAEKWPNPPGLDHLIGVLSCKIFEPQLWSMNPQKNLFLTKWGRFFAQNKQNSCFIAINGTNKVVFG